MGTTTLRHGATTPTVRQQIEKMQAGLSFRAVTSLQKALDLPLGTMATVLGMSRATLHRRKIQGKIDQDESERLMRYQRLLKKAADVFGDVEIVLHGQDR